MGLENKDISHLLEVNPRTVNRWESGAYDLPDFTQAWMAERWEAWLDRLDGLLGEIDELPPGSEIDLAVYVSDGSLAAAGSDLTVREANALNRALAVSLGLADLVPIARVVPVGD